MIISPLLNSKVLRVLKSPELTTTNTDKKVIRTPMSCLKLTFSFNQNQAIIIIKAGIVPCTIPRLIAIVS